jgi:C4-dicarboxylate-binding protein DctP
MYTQKMHEVQKFATLTNHGYLGYAVIVNKKFWDGLPQDVRASLTKAMDESTDYANSIAKEENDKALEAMKAAGTTKFHTLTDDELKTWRTTLAPVRKQMADRIGADLVKRTEAAAGTK